MSFTPTLTSRHKEVRYNAFTPIFKKIHWNKYRVPDYSDDFFEHKPIPNRKATLSHQLSESTKKKKDEVIKEKIISKYIPARYINISSIEKLPKHDCELKFTLPTIKSDLKLLKDINRHTIDINIAQDKLILKYFSGCRQESRKLLIERRVRFQLV